LSTKRNGAASENESARTQTNVTQALSRREREARTKDIGSATPNDEARGRGNISKEKGLRLELKFY
jgi:hypothetical protein